MVKVKAKWDDVRKQQKETNVSLKIFSKIDLKRNTENFLTFFDIFKFFLQCVLN